jgi:4-diphosphocytidyl-2-C-methyl-D-erythritol kinase
LIVEAPAKLNLCLYLGPRRPDGFHELVSIFCPLSLADRIVVTPSDADEVICPGVPDPNLASAALVALRERGWRAAPVRVEIEKRIPVAGGLGGGSADAAAVLRLSAGEVEGLAAIAARLGSDVPSQLDPAPALVSGAGERVDAVPAPPPLGVVAIPAASGLATAAVYAEADRLGIGRDRDELAEVAARLRAALASDPSPLSHPELLVNDLEPAALSLRPELAEPLAALRQAGAAALLAGSGPTAVGLFGDRGAAEAAAAMLAPTFAGAFTATLAGRQR